jgi:DNA invertase Pin-like site-specific DNA recombinase
MKENKKVTSAHLSRDSYLYIRQSSLKQVVGNQESTKRQYALRNRAIALGWNHEQIVVIDSDQGQSGAESANREGFQKLVARVGMGKAGIVMGLEVSRLARNSSDWHRLLEICALTDTLILDEDGIYDPSHFNDRLLLGLKGTMSEAELHILRARLRGGILNKARRGELKSLLPVGFIYDSEDRVVFDPDKQVQDSIMLLFRTFEGSGSAYSVVKYFRENGLTFPKRPQRGVNKGELLWGILRHSSVLRILHNPRYAGIYTYGRSKSFTNQSTKKFQKINLKRDQWQVFLPESHKGYISQDQYELNQRKLLENAQANGSERRKSPPREGPALLQGLMICGVCGRRMTVEYRKSRKSKTGLSPVYVCQTNHVEFFRKCQRIPGAQIDEAVGDLLVKMMTPVTLQVALSVQQEIESQANQIKEMRKKRVERARYEADLMRRRYMNVDPQNRLVADSLEAEWNEKLRGLAQQQEEYEAECNNDCKKLSEKQKKDLLDLASDFPKLWKGPNTPDKERKRMVRLLIEDVTLIKDKDKDITTHIRFKGGAKKRLNFPLPVNNFVRVKTKPEIIRQVDILLDQYTYQKIASALNKKGIKTSKGSPFTALAVSRIRAIYGLKKRYNRLREKGFLTRKEIIKELGTTDGRLKKWKDNGLIKVHAYGDCGTKILYELPGKEILSKLICAQ